MSVVGGQTFIGQVMCGKIIDVAERTGNAITESLVIIDDLKKILETNDSSINKIMPITEKVVQISNNLYNINLLCRDKDHPL